MNNNKKLLLFSTACLLLGAFLLGAHYYKKEQSKVSQELVDSKQQLLHRDTAMTLGPEDAKVVLVEFLDPECETCRAFYPYVKQLLQQYPNDLKLELRYAPFHPNASFAIRLIEAARMQGKYWEALEKVLMTQPQWGSHHDPKPELLWDILAQLELDMDKLKEDMSDPSIEAYIQRDIKDGKSLQVRKTPSFFINGKPLEPFGLAPLKEMIRDAVERE